MYPRYYGLLQLVSSSEIECGPSKRLRCTCLVVCISTNFRSDRSVFSSPSRHSLSTSELSFIGEASSNLRSVKPLSRMLLYKDIITGDEIVSDAFPMYAFKLMCTVALTNEFGAINHQKTR